MSVMSIRAYCEKYRPEEDGYRSHNANICSLLVANKIEFRNDPDDYGLFGKSVFDKYFEVWDSGDIWSDSDIPEDLWMKAAGKKPRRKSKAGRDAKKHIGRMRNIQADSRVSSKIKTVAEAVEFIIGQMNGDAE